MNITKISFILGIVFSLVTLYLSYKEFKKGTIYKRNFKKIIICTSIVIILVVFIISRIMNMQLY